MNRAVQNLLFVLAFVGYISRVKVCWSVMFVEVIYFVTILSVSQNIPLTECIYILKHRNTII
jgi:hypothetical protein